MFYKPLFRVSGYGIQFRFWRTKTIAQRFFPANIQVCWYYPQGMTTLFRIPLARGKRGSSAK